MKKFQLPNNFDYKNIDVLRQFITETGKIVPARVTGISASNQRKVTKSIKIARFLALLPYTDMHQKNEDYNTRQNSKTWRNW